MTKFPTARVDQEWLALRGPADVRARDAGTTGLVNALVDSLTDRPGHQDGVLRLVDVGAGTGAGATWLRQRLPIAQRWRLVDPDRDLLATAAPITRGWAVGVLAGAATLAETLSEEPADVVTCQALLDLLTAAEVEQMLAPAVDCRAALLLSLSVTGTVTLSPGHTDDRWIGDAFDTHQRRSGRLGPDAGAYAARALRGAGYEVATAASPWHLGTADRALSRAWLRGRAAAAAEQEPSRAGQADRWLRDRIAAVDDGRLHAVVGHVDVLALPPP